MTNQKRLLVISGPAGSGKDTVVKEILLKHRGVEISVSATTRQPRAGETDGIDYFFISKNEFENKISKGELLEYTSYVGNYYGTLKSEVDTRLEKGLVCVLIIEVEGAANIKAAYPCCTTIFIMPPSMEELERRLRGRGSETEEDLKKRLQKAEQEMKEAPNYDYIVTNASVELCAEEIMRILEERQCENN